MRPSVRQYQLWCETTHGRRTRSRGQSPRRLTFAWKKTSHQRVQAQELARDGPADDPEGEASSGSAAGRLRHHHDLVARCGRCDCREVWRR